MAVRIQDLKPLARQIKDVDMLEMQGADVGSARISVGDIKNFSVQGVASEKDFQDHVNQESENGVLGHIQLENDKIPAALLPVNYDASFQQFAGSFIYFASDKNLPHTVVPCYGGKIYPDQFKDKLASLKSKIPQEWIQLDGSVILPDLTNKTLVFSPVHKEDYETSPIVGQRYPNLYTTSAGVVPFLIPRNDKKYSVIICIVTGEMETVTNNETFFLHDPVSGEYTGKEVELPVVNGQPVGKSDHMKASIEKKRQSEIAKDYWENDLCGDPLGLLSGADQNPTQINTEFNLEKIPEEKRTFNMSGIPMTFAVDKGILYVYRQDDKDHYIAFVGGFSYVKKQVFDSGATLLVNSNSVRIHSKKIEQEYQNPATNNALPFSGWYNYNVIIAIRGGQFIFQLGVDLNNNERVIIPFGKWIWYDFYQRNNQQYKDMVLDWLDKMPDHMVSDIEKYPNIPLYRTSIDWVMDANRDAATVWYSEMETKQITYTQNQLIKEYWSETPNGQDKFRIRDMINAQNFDIDNIMPINGRKLYIDGYIVTLDIKPDYFEWETDGYKWRVETSPVWDQGGLGNPANPAPARCNAAFKLINQANRTKNKLFLPDGRIVETTTNVSIEFWFYVRDIGTAISSNQNIPKWNVFSAMINAANNRQDAEEFFKNFPLNWSSTQNQTDKWNGANNNFHWFMKNL